MNNEQPAGHHLPETAEDPHALAAAFALDAVDDDERASFEQHLAHCSDCRAEVSDLRDLGAELSGVAEAAPPASLRRGVLAGISDVAQLSPTATRPTPASTSMPADELATRRSARPRKRLATWAAGAAAAAVLIGGGIAWHPWSPDQTTTQLTAVEQVTGAKDAQRFVKPVDGATVTLVRSSDKGRAVLVAKDMPPAPRGHVYEVWYFDRSGQPVKAGLVPHSDAPEITLLLDGDAATAKGAGVTLEPAGGSDKPTTKPLVTFEFV